MDGEHVEYNISSGVQLACSSGQDVYHGFASTGMLSTPTDFPIFSALTADSTAFIRIG